MKLSQAKKDSILVAVIKDLYPKKMEDKKTEPIVKELEKFLDERFLPGWENYVKYMSTQDIVFINTPTTGRLFFRLTKGYPDRGALSSFNSGFSISIDVLPGHLRELITELSLWMEEKKEKEELFSKILSSVNTENQLVGLLPEMNKYLPQSLSEITDMVSVDALKKAREAISGNSNRNNGGN